MTMTVPQAILDALTDVGMPEAMPTRAPVRIIDVSGMRIPAWRSEALVLGSGAAGLRAAVELKRRDVDVMVATQTLFWGTSACSGSDKQTLHTASTGRRGDNFVEMARSIAAGGAMDADTAYVEAVGSVDAFAGLRFIGLPLPEDRFGAVLRYQTDHDEVGRATSCGPRTSRLMVSVLAAEAVRLGVPFVNRCTGLELLVEGEGPARRVCGLLAVRSDGRTDDNPYGLVVFEAPAVVLATGGPGELFRDSVYPKHCFGSLGLALEAGVELTNLTECQFGIGTRREEFPWNLSGTYVQAMPYVYSLDTQGNEHNFLADYYRSTQELALERLPQGLPVALPCEPHARLRIEPRRSRGVSRVAGRPDGLHGLQPQPGAGARGPAVRARSPRRRRPQLPAQQRRAARGADRAPAPDESALDRAVQALRPTT